MPDERMTAEAAAGRLAKEHTDRGTDIELEQKARELSADQRVQAARLEFNLKLASETLYGAPRTAWKLIALQAAEAAKAGEIIVFSLPAGTRSTEEEHKAGLFSPGDELHVAYGGYAWRILRAGFRVQLRGDGSVLYVLDALDRVLDPDLLIPTGQTVDFGGPLTGAQFSYLTSVLSLPASDRAWIDISPADAKAIITRTMTRLRASQILAEAERARMRGRLVPKAHAPPGAPTGLQNWRQDQRAKFRQRGVYEVPAENM